MPTIAIVLFTMTFSTQNSVLSSRAKLRDPAAQRATSASNNPVTSYRRTASPEWTPQRTPPRDQRNPASPSRCRRGPFATSFSRASLSGMFGTTVDPALAFRRGPMDGVAQDLPNDRMKIDRIGFVARTEIKDLAVAAFPGAAAPENFAAFKPGEKNDLVRRRDGERFAIHLGVLDFETAIDPAGDRMPGIANPETLPFARLAPGERTARAHQALEDFRVMRRVQRDESHPFPDAAEHTLDDRVLHLAVRGVTPPEEDVGFG